MPKFATQYDAHQRVHQPAGDPIKTLYAPVFDKQGHMSLEVSGKESLYDYIQSHAESVDIHVILKQFAQGDVSVLARVQGTYGDFTQMPKTFAEALNTMIAAEQYFQSLPVETRAQFGHNFNQFIASMDAPDFTKRMGIDPSLGTPDPAAVAPGAAAAPGSVPAPTPATPPSAPASSD
ncbi:internal scaffolding protein [Sigmofec virus UA08Rod_5539]|uniref:Internal scaffolding protein n=1 Tax=Sigmofec virus UA08Rod_5539 TaxID=2929428 RepID=A0A976R7C2_9VIRU|nr:internal scaffolding protein [Sigmofec virus UA08Rod_5539]